MTRSHLFTILATLVTAALVWYGVTTYPLGRQEVNVISTQGAPQKIITLNPGDTASQTFRPVQHLASSFSIFTVNDKLSGQKITAAITDSSGNQLATSVTARPSYQDEKLKLTFPIAPTDWLETNINQDFTINIKLNSGPPLQLLTLTENIYKKGVFSLNNELVEDLDLSISSTQPQLTPAGTKKGVAAGLIILLGALVIQLIPHSHHRWRWISASLLLVIVTPLALGGFWIPQDKLGISDWDHNFAQHEIIRSSLLTYHTFPFWNPYTCGGTAGLADPEFPLFTPTFLLELIFGIPLGLRLAIFLSTALGALGMLTLAKRIGLSPLAALLAALVAFFGTVNLLEIVEGHPNIFSAMWIPWIFWAWLGAYRKRRSGLLCGIFLALTFYQGGIYLLFYTSLAFLILILLVPRRRAALLITVQAGLWALGLAAIKLIPALLWLTQFQDEAYATSTYTLPRLYEILLGRHLHGSQILLNQATGWHEYGAYIGPLTLALVLLSLTNIRRRLVWLLSISVLLTIFLSSAGPLLEPLFNIAPFLPRSTISRVILFSIIPLSLLAGLGLDQIKSWRPRLNFLLIPIVGLLAVDLMSLAYPLSQQAFVIPQDEVRISSAPAPIAFTDNSYQTRLNGVDYTRSYLAVKAGYGNLDYCTPLSPPPNVITVQQTSEDSSIISVDQNKGSVQLTSWSYNYIQAKATISETADILINTNYAKGWRMNGLPAKEISNRVGTTLKPGTYDLTFRYHTPGFLPGLFTTAATLLAAILASFRSVQPRSKHQHHSPAKPPPTRPTNRLT